MADYIDGLDVYAASSYRVEVSSGHRIMRKVPLTARVNIETGEVTFSIPKDKIDALRRD